VSPKREKSEEARSLQLEHNKLEVRKAQEKQRDFRKHVEESKRKEDEEHALRFRKTIQEELVTIKRPTKLWEKLNVYNSRGSKLSKISNIGASYFDKRGHSSISNWRIRKELPK